MIAYGVLNVLQHGLFMIQFFLYERRHNWRFLTCLLIPLVPYMLVEWLPATVAVTNYLKVSQPVGRLRQRVPCLTLLPAGHASAEPHTATARVQAAAYHGRFGAASTLRLACADSH